jgi:[acyl-carrier-protein] S-malonyltransferase
MGADICAQVPSSKEIYQKASQVLGWDVGEICFNGPESELAKTSMCQAAVLVTSLAVVEALRGRGARGAGCAAGLSLGEYTALVYAGAIEFEQAVHLVSRRGEFMQQASEETAGGMSSIIGLDLKDVESVCQEAGKDVHVANINSPGQVVVSGRSEALPKVEELAAERGAKKTVRLDVAGAFHSPFMESAAEKLAEELRNTEIKPPSIPIFSNVTSKALPDSAEGIRETLVRQVTSRVLWIDCVKNMIGGGAADFLEIGPGKVLTGLLRRIDRTVKCKPVCSVGDLEAVEK